MQAIYPCAQLICLICAIIFVGFLFFGAIIFSRAKKKPSAKIAQKAQQAIPSVAIKIMSPLALTGGMMTGGRVGSKAGGHFGSNLQIAFIALSTIVANLTCKFCSSLPGDFHRSFASAALIAICAKITFIV